MTKANAVKQKIGRPTDYSEELAARICERLSNGEPLAKMCREDDMPSAASVYLWLIKYPAFSEMYTRAREDQADTMADQIVDIADNSTGEDANVARLRVDARKWVAAKLKPRKYGDRLTSEHTGLDGGPVKTENKHTVEFVNASPRKSEV